MPAPDYDIIIVGTGPAGLGAAFQLSEVSPPLSILMKAPVRSGQQMAV